MIGLNELELQRLEEFQDAHPGKVTLTFTQTGIGVAITAKAEDGARCELTDFSNW